MNIQRVVVLDPHNSDPAYASIEYAEVWVVDADKIDDGPLADVRLDAWRFTNNDSDKRTIVERMENLVSALEDAMQHIADDDRHDSDEYNDVNNAYGIAGEILTMLDGR